MANPAGSSDLVSGPALFDFSRFMSAAKRGSKRAPKQQSVPTAGSTPATRTDVAPYPADLAPSLLPAGSFDLVSELVDNRRAYLCSADKDQDVSPLGEGDNEAAVSYLSILSWPPACRINVDRIRQHATEESARSGGNPHKVPTHPTVACALHWGSGLLASSEPVLALQSLRLQFTQASPDLDPLISRTLDTFFCPSPGAYDLPTGDRRNFRVPSGILRPLSDLSSDLGIPRYAVAVVSVMAALCDQPRTNRGDAREMRRAVEQFLATVDVRVRAIRALLREFAV